jgi:SAM-dependent methyltransferase
VHDAGVDLHTDRPHPARVYNYLLGGDVYFDADRIAAEQGMKSNPTSRVPPRENRAFLRRAVHYLAAERGIDQFLDIGTGIPSAPNVHHVAQSVHPGARVVYVDHDPIVLAHAQGLLDGTGETRFLKADLLDPGAILGSPEVRETLDLDRPVGLLLVAVLHFVGDDHDPYALVKEFVAALPPGSYLVLSHLTGDFVPEAWAAVTEIYRKQGVTMRVRTKTEVARFFTGLDLVDPGLQVLPHWRPDTDEPAEPDGAVSVYGGVARKA